MRHFLSIADYNPSEFGAILDLANDIKRNQARYRTALAGRTLAMIFEKRSTRTRVSFEVGMFQLGGHAIFLSSQDIQIGRGETVSDTAKVLSRYCDLVMARVYKHSDLEELANYGSVPVINGLSDLLHPCQAACDYMTLIEKWSPKGGWDRASLRGRKIAYVGDGNNMSHSLVNGAVKVGMDVAVATPVGYEPKAHVIEAAREAAKGFGDGVVPKVEVFTDPREAVRGAHCVYTDVWASMGQEGEKEKRLKDFEGFIVNNALMANADKDAVFMHCLPAHRGEEVASEVIDGPQSIVFDQAENRLHVQKGIMVYLAGMNR